MVDSSDGIRTVVLRRNEGTGLGFSIMGGAGYEFPPVIYGIEKDSPAARSGLLEAGDTILAINEREVVKLSTKEVLKCLRLSGDIVNIKFKRDAQIVSRVRQFLSTPNYHEGGDFHHQLQHHHGVAAQVIASGKTHQSPSSGAPRTTSTNSPSHKPPERGASDGDFRSSPNNISFSDDIFINNTHSTSTPLSSSNSNAKNKQHNSPSNGTNKNNWKTPTNQGSQVKKNYEAFVMTGDAILNISRIDPNDIFRRPSPTKTKLTPMSVPPHQIYTDRSSKPSPPKNKIASPPPPAMVDENIGSKDASEDSEVSPPLPPPPKSSSSSNSNSSATEPTHVTVKSDNLPPPPPSLMDNYEDEAEAELLLQHAQSHSNGNGFARAEELAHFTKTKGVKKARANNNETNTNGNNNEDTSISSSVMSDSGEELEDDNEEKTKTRKKPSLDSENNHDDEKGSEKLERERYNEYILLNGRSGGATNDDDDDHSSESSARAKGYEKIPTSNDSDDQGEDDLEEIEGNLSRQQQQIRRFQSLHSSSGGGESFNSSGGDSDGSDVESMRVAPVTKAVDIPSAERLAKRLYALDGFKVSDVWRQLSKANDFSRTVATEYLNYFEFKDEQLDVSLRKFLNVCPLRGETTEKERVLTYFSNRYVDCNPNLFASQDAVHTLACALMLLNSDMYSASAGPPGRRMTSKDFIQNLSGLNDGGNFPEQILRKLYQSIKSRPLSFPDADDNESNRDILPMDPSINTNTKEFKRGYLKKKSTFETGGKKTQVGKRAWKMYFCRLRDLILILASDESNKASVTQNTPIKLHHAYATVAHDYQKKPYVFQLTLADRSQYLFQSSDIREMNSWIDNINLNSARFSSPALEAPCGSSKRFERPLLPSGISRLSPRDQLLTHQGAIAKWEEEEEDLNQILASKKKVPSKKEVKERQAFYQYELKRYKAYVDVLERHLNDKNGGDSSGSELIQLQVLPNPPAVLVEMDE